jgi:hypothetical protein
MAISNRNNKRLYEKLAELPNNLRRRIEQQSLIAELIFSNLGMPTSSVQLQSGVLESFQDASDDTSSAHKAFEQFWWIGIIRAQQAYVERFEQCLQVLTGRLAERGLTPPIELVRDVVMVTLDEAARIIGERPSALDMVIDVLPVLMKNAAEIFGEEFSESE